MHFRINPLIFERFPGLHIGLLLVKNIHKSTDTKAINDLLLATQSVLNKELTTSQVTKHPLITCWKEAYKNFGVRSKDYPSSIENLATRITKGAILKPINTVVDLYNTVSLKYLLPVGAQDLDAIHGDIQLTVATNNEQSVHLLGEKETRAPRENEIFYKDNNGATCRRWNWKEAERTKIRPETINALIVIEGLPPAQPEMVRDATLELGHLLTHYCKADITYAMLNAQHQSIELAKNGSYTSLQPLTKPSDTLWSVYALGQEEESITQETQIRIEKVNAMRTEGIDPWPAAYPIKDSCKEVLTEFGSNQQQEAYTVAGRLMALRWHGKTAFGDIQDDTCRIQVYFRKDILGEQKFSLLKNYIDIGDILCIVGSVFRTKMGEVTIDAIDILLLSKCLRPLPEKFHGLTDTETRYRQRYLDLISNPESKEKFIRRTRLIKAVRTFLDEHGFLEVETPLLHPIAGGAAARPFITHHNALDSDFYLRIAPELYLKRLVVGGISRVYELNKNFRNEGVSTRHNPEFTMLEFYMAHKDYHFAMNFVEELLRTVIQQSCGTLQIPYAEHTLDFSSPFKRISIYNSVIELGGLNEKDDLALDRIDATLNHHNINLRTGVSYEEKVYALFEKLVEHQLIQPTFVTDFPIAISPLAKRDPKNPTIAARFELYIGGMELSNGFNELNDPFDQADRFQQQLEAHRAGDEEAHQFDADYIQSLEYALPPTTGVGIGIDRLVMLATDTPSIRDVILFPTLKKKK